MSSHGWSSLSHTNVEEEGPTHERDACDIEMEELRMQVQQLQQCLEHYKALSCTESHHNIEHEAPNNEDKDINPFHRDLNQHSREVSPPPHVRRNCNVLRDHDVKVDILEFVRKMQPDDFVD